MLDPYYVPDRHTRCLHCLRGSHPLKCLVSKSFSSSGRQSSESLPLGKQYRASMGPKILCSLPSMSPQWSGYGCGGLWAKQLIGSSWKSEQNSFSVVLKAREFRRKIPCKLSSASPVCRLGSRRILQGVSKRVWRMQLMALKERVDACCDRAQGSLLLSSSVF